MLSPDLMVASTPPLEFREDSMHAISFLEKWFQHHAVISHQARAGALVRVVGALLSGERLALPHLGRHRRGGAFLRHRIKAVNRLPGNRHLNRERSAVDCALLKTMRTTRFMSRQSAPPRAPHPIFYTEAGMLRPSIDLQPNGLRPHRNDRSTPPRTRHLFGSQRTNWAAPPRSGLA